MSAAPNATPQLSPAASKPPKPRMSTRNRVLFLFTGWLIVLMPFLFWWSTWFGRQLPDKQLAEYLQDAKHPRHIQHALVQIGERMTRHDASVTKWYPQVVSLAAYPVEEVRNTDAWVMGQDVSGKDASDAGFHDALLKMLDDPSLSVRGNAALSLVRFGDAEWKAADPGTPPASHGYCSAIGKSSRHERGRHSHSPRRDRRKITTGRSDDRNSLPNHGSSRQARRIDRTNGSGWDANRNHRSRHRTSLGSVTRSLPDWPA